MRKIEPRNVTTSGTIGGWEITGYSGPVVAHAVSGAGFATELFAGFSDMFGGKSQAIRDRLGEIHRDALDQLCEKAAALGANWIVGMRADTGEISGKNKMMFMVTVSGTAVMAQKVSREGAGTASDAPKEVTNTQLVDEDTRIRLSQLSNTHDLDSDDVFRDIVAHRVECLAPLVLAWVREAHEERRDERIKRASAFFANLDRDTASQSIYANAVVPSVPARMCEKIILVRLHLMSLERTASLLESASREERWWGLQTLSARQGTYRETDLALVDRCNRAIQGLSISQAEVIKVKKLMGSKQVWLCLSGHKNSENCSRCDCGLDREGFRSADVTPEKALRSLARVKLALESCLGDGPAQHCSPASEAP